jgi:hypothetical protein
MRRTCRGLDHLLASGLVNRLPANAQRWQARRLGYRAPRWIAWAGGIALMRRLRVGIGPDHVGDFCSCAAKLLDASAAGDLINR